MHILLYYCGTETLMVGSNTYQDSVLPDTVERDLRKSA